MSSPQAVKPVVSVSPKSVGIAIILTVLFGPLGMFYSTVAGAIIMMVVSVVAAVLTVGIGLLVTWPICIVWGAVSANSYNKKLLGTP